MHPQSMPLPEALSKETRAQNYWAGAFPQQACPSCLKRSDKHMPSLKMLLSGPVWHVAEKVMASPLLQRVPCLYSEGMPTSKMNTNSVISRQIHPRMGCTLANLQCACVHQGGGSRGKWPPEGCMLQEPKSSQSGKPPGLASLSVKLREPEKRRLHWASPWLTPCQWLPQTEIGTRLRWSVTWHELGRAGYLPQKGMREQGAGRGAL